MLANVARSIVITRAVATRGVVARLAATAVAGHLVGSLPVANTVARRHGIDDLRTVGDHNPGYWNARETLGVPAAAPILVGDTAKGVIGAAIGAIIGRHGGRPWAWATLGGGAAMVGHAFPVGSGLRGGRSVLALVGTSMVAAPRAAAIAVALAAGVRAATGRFDVAARAGVAAFPVVQLVVDGPRRTAVSGILMTFVGARFATAR